MLVEGGCPEFDVGKSGPGGPADQAALDTSGTPQRPYGPVEVVIVSCAEDQAKLIEPTRPVFFVGQVVRDLHALRIPERGDRRHPRYSRRTFSHLMAMAGRAL